MIIASTVEEPAAGRLQPFTGTIASSIGEVVSMTTSAASVSRSPEFLSRRLVEIVLAGDGDDEQSALLGMERSVDGRGIAAAMAVDDDRIAGIERLVVSWWSRNFSAYFSVRSSHRSSRTPPEPSTLPNHARVGQRVEADLAGDQWHRLAAPASIRENYGHRPDRNTATRWGGPL
nr:hypothetical protein [Aminobacter anthyllidis]